MKKTAKVIIALMFCLSIISATMVSVFAVNQVKGLTAKSITYNSATISWTKTSSVKGYAVEQYKSSKWTQIATTTSTSYTIKSLSTGSTYAFRVRAYTQNIFGKKTYGAYSSTLKVKAVPAQVTGFKVAALTYSAVKLTWTKVSGASAYYLQQYVSGKWVKVNSKITTNTYTIKSLKTGSKYYYRVLAYRTVSGKNIAGPVSSALKVIPTLNTPTALTPSGITTSSVKLSWKAVSGATGYQVYQYTSSKTWKRIKAPSTTSYTASTLSAGTNAYFRVRAYIKVGSGYAYSAFTDTLKVTGAPAAPTSLKTSAVTDSTITISWGAPKGAVGYRAYMYDYSAAKWTALATTKTTATFTGLDSMTKYAFKVRAYNTTNSVNYYSAYSSATTGTTTIGKVTGLAIAENTSSSATISWTAINGAAKYAVEKYDSTTAAWNLIDETETVAYTDAIINPQINLYRVRAIDVQGNYGAYSDSFNAYPETVEVAPSGAYQTVLKWKAVVNAASYKIYSKVPGSSTWFEETTVTTNYATLFFAPQSIQNIRVIAYQADGTTYAGMPVYASTFVTSPLTITTSDYSQRTQILYLVRAINNAKRDNGVVTIDRTIKSSYNVDSIKFLGVTYSGKTLQSFISGLSGGDDISMNESTTDVKKVKFENGIGTFETTDNDGNKITRQQSLVNFVEPTSASNMNAYLYGAQDVNAKISNGFSSVTTAANSYGGYTITLVLKKESTAKYHSGLVASVDASSLAGDGMTASSTVGASTVKGVIDANGNLISLGISSPYAVKATFADAGNALVMNMSGATSMKYTFTR